MISLQDAIELALENNTDILIQRYYPSIADLDLIRTAAGANGRGVGNVNVPGSLRKQSWDGQLRSGDHLHGDVRQPALSREQPADRRHGNNLDGAVRLSLRTTPTPTCSTSRRFRRGTSIAAALNTIRASTTSQAQFFSPSVQTVGSFAITQQLLNGWGFALNKRAIRIARIARKGSDLAFAQSVLTDITSVENFYWELVFARGDVEVQRRSVELAQRLYDDNQRQVQIGTLAPLEIVRAEAQLATAQQNLINAQTRQMQQQNSLMNVIVKDLVDPTLVNIEVDSGGHRAGAPPVVENLPLTDAIQEAMTKRPDVQLSKLNLTAHDINLETVRSALLPTVTVQRLRERHGTCRKYAQGRPSLRAASRSALDTVFAGDFPGIPGAIYAEHSLCATVRRRPTWPARCWFNSRTRLACCNCRTRWRWTCKTRRSPCGRRARPSRPP